MSAEASTSEASSSERGCLLSLPVDELGLIFDQLAPLDLMHFAACNRDMRVLGLSDRVWRPRLSEMLDHWLCLSWRFSPHDLPLRPGGVFPGGPGWLPYPAKIDFCQSAAFCFWKARHDGSRTAIAPEELASFEWCFRFKAAAGESWIRQDPWWNNQEPIRLKLHADGTVRPLTDAHPFWGSAGSVGGHWRLEPGVWSPRNLPPSQRAHPTSAVVTMNGHPSYTVRRHPQHGGLFLESCWCVWTGFPMLPRGGRDVHMEDSALRLGVDDPRQRLEVNEYNGVAPAP